MKKNERNWCRCGIVFTCAFAIWTALILIIDVQPLGQEGTDIGFAALNCRFHKLTGVHMTLYTITDWMGIVPIFVCLIFAAIGLIQLIKRKSLFKVDSDILILGAYYIIVMIAYSIFEIITVNYRPVLINGKLEASYPSSTTLLVLCVMPTLIDRVQRRLPSVSLRRIIRVAAVFFSVFTVAGRLISGVHWLTDIIGGVLLSMGLFSFYRAAVCSSAGKHS